MSCNRHSAEEIVAKRRQADVLLAHGQSVLGITETSCAMNCSMGRSSTLCERPGSEPPSLKWSDLKYVFCIKEDRYAEEEVQAGGDRRQAKAGGCAGLTGIEPSDRGQRGLTSAFLGWLGLSRRGLLASAWVLVLTPLHWLLLPLAAWRGLYQLVISTFAWEKTEHSLAKSSRLAAGMTRSLLELERHFTGLIQTDDLPTLANRATDTVANRRPLPRAAA
jgi:hypothetical protein